MCLSTSPAWIFKFPLDFSSSEVEVRQLRQYSNLIRKNTADQNIKQNAWNDEMKKQKHTKILLN